MSELRPGTPIVVALIVVALVIAAAASYAIYAQGLGRPAAPPTAPATSASSTASAGSPSNSSYGLAVEELADLLADAREFYEAGAFQLFGDNATLSAEIAAGSQVANDSVIVVGGRPYRFALLYLYNADTGFLFAPGQVEAGGFAARLLPNPTVTTSGTLTYTVTYVGGTPYTYLITYGNETYRFTFAFIGFTASSYHLTVSTYSLGGGAYAVQVTVARELGNGGAVSYAWLVLAPAG